MSQTRRRQLQRRNNLLTIVVILFIILLNAPTLIKEYLIKKDPNEQIEEVLRLLSSEDSIATINFEMNALIFKNNRWQLEKENGQSNSEITPETLANNWQTLQGTYISPALFEQFKPNLKKAEPVEIWLKNREKSYQFKVYHYNDIWLINNWQNHWIAVTTSRERLFPL